MLIASNSVDRDRAVQLRPVARRLTRVVTDTAVDGRERIVRHQNAPGPLVIAHLDMREVLLDVLANRTRVRTALSATGREQDQAEA